MSSIQEQQYFVTELSTPSNFSPSLLPFLLFGLILYFIYFLPKSGFLYCHLLIPSLFCIQESQDSSRWLSPGRVTGAPYSPEPHRGWVSVVRWGLPALCSQPLFLKAEIKSISLNKTEGHFAMKKVLSSWNPSPFVKDHLTLLHTTTRKVFIFKSSSFTSWGTFIQIPSDPRYKEMLSASRWTMGLLGALLLLIAGELRPKRLLESRPPWSSSSNTSCPLPTISQLDGSRTRKLITFLQNNNIESSLSRLMVLWCSWKPIKNPKIRSTDHPRGGGEMVILTSS